MRKSRFTEEQMVTVLREADLADVKRKCELHGFTATDLRGYLKTKGRGRKTVTRKSGTAPTTPRRKKSAS